MPDDIAFATKYIDDFYESRTSWVESISNNVIEAARRFVDRIQAKEVRLFENELAKAFLSLAIDTIPGLTFMTPAWKNVVKSRGRFLKSEGARDAFANGAQMMFSTVHSAGKSLRDNSSPDIIKSRSDARIKAEMTKKADAIARRISEKILQGCAAARQKISMEEAVATKYLMIYWDCKTDGGRRAGGFTAHIRRTLGRIQVINRQQDAAMRAAFEASLWCTYCRANVSVTTTNRTDASGWNVKSDSYNTTNGLRKDDELYLFEHFGTAKYPVGARMLIPAVSNAQDLVDKWKVKHNRAASTYVPRRVAGGM